MDKKNQVFQQLILRGVPKEQATAAIRAVAHKNRQASNSLQPDIRQTSMDLESLDVMSNRAVHTDETAYYDLIETENIFNRNS